jgi:hypothetical protein
MGLLMGRESESQVEGAPDGREQAQADPKRHKAVADVGRKKQRLAATQRRGDGGEQARSRTGRHGGLAIGRQRCRGLDGGGGVARESDGARRGPSADMHSFEKLQGTGTLSAGNVVDGGSRGRTRRSRSKGGVVVCVDVCPGA